jgi:hypothetical protein
MKIENLRSNKNGELARIAAIVTWEDCDRPTQEIYFETTEVFAEGLTCNPHTFLLACIMSAMRHGEKRIFIDAEICPELRHGMITAMSWIRQWYGLEQQLVQIEAKTQSYPPTPRIPERAGFFFSGGIDSLTTLRTNRLDIPFQHPRSFKDGLLIYGLELQDPEFFKQLVSSLSSIALDAGVSLIPVYTNIRSLLGEDWSFWGKEIQGAVLSAVAHAFSRRLTIVTIPSSFDIYHLYPYGSHPLLDPNYSSSDLQIRHDSILLTRLDKTKLVANWDVALQNLRVCNQISLIPPGALNCGQCEKCVRTMTALLALGVLNKTRAFPKVDISEELLLEKARIKNPPYSESSYREMIAPLAAKGRDDLVRGLQSVIDRYHESERMRQRKEELRQRKERLKQIDRKLTKGKLLKFYQAVTRTPDDT